MHWYDRPAMGYVVALGYSALGIFTACNAIHADGLLNTSLNILGTIFWETLSVSSWYLASSNNAK